MTTAEREVLTFIEKNHPVAKGTLRDCFPHWDTAMILAELASAGLVTKEPHPTVHGEQYFYSPMQPAGSTRMP